MSSLADRRSIEAFLQAHKTVVEPTLYAAGQSVDGWQIVAYLGRGSSGEVYRVRHAKLGVVAAMKVLVREDDQSRTRFRREATIFASHAIPVFPRFFGYGEVAGRSYLVIELLEDYELPSTDRAVARYLCQVCEGVSRLHALGLVHRDIKPSNILRRPSDGRPILVDLGLVKDTARTMVHRDASFSLVNGRAVGVGTPKYAAPEQFSGGEISPAADIHALGMLANECFGGKPHGPWVRIIRRSTSTISSQRYATVGAFVSAVRKRHLAKVLVGALAPLGIVSLLSSPWLGWNSVRQPGALTQSLPPGSGAVQGAATETNHVFEARDKAGPKEKIKGQGGVSYPRPGVFGGDRELDPNF